MDNSLDRLVLDVDQALSANFSASNIILGGISGLSYSYVLLTHLIMISKTDGSNFNASTVDDVIASNGVKATSNSNMVRTHAISFVDAAGNTSASAIATWGEMVKINLNDVYASLGGFVINVELGGDISGGSVSNAGDVNDDEYADLLLGAAGPNGYAGKIYVTYGGANFLSANNNLYGTSSNNSLTGTSASESFFAADGKDTLIGNGGADVINGGKGNDIFQINARNITALQNVAGAGGNTTQLSKIDGGTGIYTLQLTTGAGNLDLTQIKNVGAGTPDGLSRLESIEIIYLSVDNLANVLRL